ncbi:hypothetical protein C8J56DRAFT_1051886 [Mycena floridula]|nr:hypothetical protein C8J56DRAFT_1051886 [Mycena floridula]
MSSKAGPSKDQTFNRNPTGRNQHVPKSEADQNLIDEHLRTYHREKIDSNKKIVKRLKNDHGIEMSEIGVKRRRKFLGLSGSRSTAVKEMNTSAATQLVLDEMGKDQARRSGVRTIQAKVAFNHSTHLPRNVVSEIMHTHAPEAFDAREPTAKKTFRVPKNPIGIHHRWAGDGHDKLYKIGFPIWAVVDDATGKYLGGWVVPSNRMGEIVGYLFLCLDTAVTSHNLIAVVWP